jgi:hypothetical protein
VEKRQRTGGGSRKGIPNKATAAREKAIAESGLTPLEFMLQVMRDENMPFPQRIQAANAVAPYVHPRLANSEVKMTGELVHHVNWTVTKPKDGA